MESGDIITSRSINPKRHDKAIGKLKAFFDGKNAETHPERNSRLRNEGSLCKISGKPFTLAWPNDETIESQRESHGGQGDARSPDIACQSDPLYSPAYHQKSRSEILHTGEVRASSREKYREVADLKRWWKTPNYLDFLTPTMVLILIGLRIEFELVLSFQSLSYLGYFSFYSMLPAVFIAGCGLMVNLLEGEPTTWVFFRRLFFYMMPLAIIGVGLVYTCYQTLALSEPLRCFRIASDLVHSATENKSMHYSLISYCTLIGVDIALGITAVYFSLRKHLSLLWRSYNKKNKVLDVPQRGRKKDKVLNRIIMVVVSLLCATIVVTPALAFDSINPESREFYMHHFLATALEYLHRTLLLCLLSSEAIAHKLATCLGQGKKYHLLPQTDNQRVRKLSSWRRYCGHILRAGLFVLLVASVIGLLCASRQFLGANVNDRYRQEQEIALPFSHYPGLDFLSRVRKVKDTTALFRWYSITKAPLPSAFSPE